MQISTEARLWGGTPCTHALVVHIDSSAERWLRVLGYLEGRVELAFAQDESFVWDTHSGRTRGPAKKWALVWDGETPADARARYVASVRAPVRKRRGYVAFDPRQEELLEGRAWWE